MPPCFVVPCVLHCGVEQFGRAGRQPLRAGQPICVALEYQQQLGPFGQMPGLIAPWTKDVGLVVLVVLPVHRPVGVVVLPDESVRQRRLPDCDVPRQLRRAIEIARLARGIERRQHGFAGVHVGVLPAIGGDRRPVRGGFVRVQTGQPATRIFAPSGRMSRRSTRAPARHRPSMRAHTPAGRMRGRSSDWLRRRHARRRATRRIRRSTHCDAVRAGKPCHAPRPAGRPRHRTGDTPSHS